MGRLTATAWVLVAVVLIATAACGTSAGSAGEPPKRADRDGGVDVAAEVVRADGGDVLRVTMTPQRAGFHLYSTDLDRSLTDGLGVPTAIDPTNGLDAIGPVTASQPDHDLHNRALGVDLPVYPDGSVTFEVPVHRTGNGDTGTVTVTYGACSASVCLPAVRGRAITVDL